jgi:preprotein translocase subunit YajC
MLAPLNHIALFLAQAQTAAPDAAQAPARSQGGGLFGGGMTQMLAIYALIIGAMYFLMFAPQRKKQKAMQKMISEIDTGDEVMTTSGIFGTIANKKDDRFVLRIADGVKIEIARSAIQGVIKRDGQDVRAA